MIASALRALDGLFGEIDNSPGGTAQPYRPIFYSSTTAKNQMVGKRTALEWRFEPSLLALPRGNSPVSPGFRQNELINGEETAK